jgi:hypothetical protein
MSTENKDYEVRASIAAASRRVSLPTERISTFVSASTVFAVAAADLVSKGIAREQELDY